MRLSRWTNLINAWSRNSLIWHWTKLLGIQVRPWVEECSWGKRVFHFCTFQWLYIKILWLKHFCPALLPDVAPNSTTMQQSSKVCAWAGRIRVGAQNDSQTWTGLPAVLSQRQQMMEVNVGQATIKKVDRWRCPFERWQRKTFTLLFCGAMKDFLTNQVPD